MTRGVSTTLSIEEIADVIQAADGDVSESAVRLNMGRSTLNRLIKLHPELKEVVDDSREGLIDLAESVTRKRMRDENLPQLQLDAAKSIFKHMGHLRGYNNTDTNVYTSGGQVVINRVVEASDKPPESYVKPL